MTPRGRPANQRGTSGRNRRGTKRSNPGRRGAGQRGTTQLRRSDHDRSRGTLHGEQVEGRHAVKELLLAGTRRVREVVLIGDLDPAPILNDIIDLADEQKITVRSVSRSRFDSVARTDAAQGVLALAAPLKSVELGELVGSREDRSVPFLLLLDGITDPQNLGAILRTAECAGVTGVVLPRHRACNITPTVTKAAAGAIEHLRIAAVGGLPAAMRTLANHGIWTVGLDAGGDRSVFDLAIGTDPVALVVGAEGVGLSRLVRARCDTVASIPLTGVIASLNVASATAIACFEIARRRS